MKYKKCLPGRSGSELGGCESQVTYKKECVFEDSPFLRLGVECSPLALLARPPDHGVEQSTLVGVDLILRQDHHQGRVVHLFESALAKDLSRLRPDDLSPNKKMYCGDDRGGQDQVLHVNININTFVRVKCMTIPISRLKQLQYC